MRRAIYEAVGISDLRPDGREVFWGGRDSLLSGPAQPAGGFRPSRRSKALRSLRDTDRLAVGATCRWQACAGNYVAL
jgi:hypothetical protein